MKVTKKNLPTLVLFIILGILIGSFTWEILERIVVLITGNPDFSLSIKNPVQLFDIYVLAVSFRANPGSILGFIASLIFFGKMK